MTLPPTPTPTTETTRTSPSPRETTSYNERFELFAGSSTLIKFLQNSSHLSQGTTLQNTIIPQVTPQIPDSSPVILPVYSTNPIQDQKRFATKLLKIQVPTSQPFVINTKTPLLPSNPIPQESTNFDEIVDAYMRNLTASQKKLLSTSLLALTDPAFPVDRQADTIRGTYGALVTTGILIPADQLGQDKSVGDIIRVVICMNQGYSSNSVEPYLYDLIISDKQTNSVVAWVPLQNINKIAELEAVKYIDCPIAAINY